VGTPDAKEFLDEALALAGEYGLLRSKASLLSSLSLVCAGLGDLRKAVQHTEASFSIQMVYGNVKGALGALLNLGSLRRQKGENREALTILRKAEAMAGDTGNVEERLACYINLANMLETEPDLEAQVRSEHQAQEQEALEPAEGGRRQGADVESSGEALAEPNPSSPPSEIEVEAHFRPSTSALSSLHGSIPGAGGTHAQLQGTWCGGEHQDFHTEAADLRKRIIHLVSTGSGRTVEDQCPVCLEDLNLGEPHMTPESWTLFMPCHHAIHYDCFQRLQKNECPLCKNRLTLG